MSGFDATDRDPPEDSEEKVPITTKDSIAPVTVKQLLSLMGDWAPGKDLLIDNQPRNRITLVGLIVSVSSDGLGSVYDVDDGTGVIKVLDATRDERTPELPPLTYCHVFGKITLSNSTAPISAISVRQVQDFNQIPYHNLQCLYVHLCLVRGLTPGAALGGADHTQI
jgi:replication factor A2